MKRIALFVFCTLISVCGFCQDDFRPLRVYEIMDIHFRILDCSSKDSLIERADSILPKGSYNQRVEWGFEGNSVGYNLVTGFQINVNEKIGGDGDAVPAVDLRIKRSSYDMESIMSFIDDFIDYLKDKKGFKGESMTTLNEADRKKMIFLWKGGFSMLDISDNGFTCELIITNYYNMSKQNKK